MKPLLIYDGECGFCREWIERWRAATGDRVDYAAYQEAADRFPEIPTERFASAVQLREADGRWTTGAEAVFRTLAHAPGRRWPLTLYRRLPGFAAISEAAYRFVARHRPALHRMTRWIWGAHVVPPGERLTSWIFLRLLALICFVAFVSMGLQITGLAGSEGILPAREFLNALQTRYGALSMWIAPTLGWLGASNAFLNGLCIVGALLSLLLAVGVAPALCLAGIWMTYLSGSILCQDFYWFQWDGLLIETCFLAMFLVPWKRWSLPGSDPAPRRVGVWLLRWLLFRLSVSSAAVKLLSGDPTWQSRTALQHYFETQPLPPWTAWFAHHLPAGALQAATTATLLIEGMAPFLLFMPRRIRFLGAGLIAALQILILTTGNFAFFNGLTLALCLLCLDDGVWPVRWVRRATPDETAPEETEPPRRRRRVLAWAVRSAAAILLLVSLVPFFRTLKWPTKWLVPVESLYDVSWTFRSVNQYGLFAVVTVRRPEIILEGSADGATWIPYEFRFKPGDPRRRPAFVAPHQPRLDWQLWFASLTDFRQQPWFLRFCTRLLEGSSSVQALVGVNPFPQAPPKYLRAILYEYQFTDAPERRLTGAWWRRRGVTLYCPVLTLENGQLTAVAPRPTP